MLLVITNREIFRWSDLITVARICHQYALKMFDACIFTVACMCLCVFIFNVQHTVNVRRALAIAARSIQHSTFQSMLSLICLIRRGPFLAFLQHSILSEVLKLFFLSHLIVAYFAVTAFFYLLFSLIFLTFVSYFPSNVWVWCCDACKILYVILQMAVKEEEEEEEKFAICSFFFSSSVASTPKLVYATQLDVMLPAALSIHKLKLGKRKVIDVRVLPFCSSFSA